MENKFIHSIDGIVAFHKLNKKYNVTTFLKKNFIENIHYISISAPNKTNDEKRGGHNRKEYLLTDETYKLMKNTYNLRNNYIVKISDTVNYISPICMCIENQTIGFICNSYGNIIETNRQHKIGKYKVDLYFPKYKLVIECDEKGHVDRNPVDEINREEYIISLGNKIIRYNPQENGFDLSNVLQRINVVLFA
jgi:very-short-patch-repair endonuclease